MATTEVTPSSFRLDRPTVLAAAFSITFLFVTGWICALIPPISGYNSGELLQKLIPFASAGLFPIFRQTLAARQRGGAPAPKDAPSYLFVLYVIVGTLLLYGFFQLVSLLIGAFVGTVSAHAASKSASINPIEFFGEVLPVAAAIVIFPMLMITSLFFGWLVHGSRLPYPLLCVLFTGVGLVLLRVLDTMWITAMSADNPLALQMLQVKNQSGALAWYGGIPGFAFVAMLVGLLSRLIVTRAVSLVRYSPV